MTTEERLSALERDVTMARSRARWALVVGVGLGILLALFPVQSMRTAQAQESGQNVLRARTLVLVDSNGKERVILEGDQETVGLYLCNPDSGERVAALCADKTDTFLMLKACEGERRVMLSVTKGTCFLGMADENGVPRTQMGVAKDASLIMRDANTKVRLSAYVAGQPGLSLLDETEKKYWSTPSR